MAKKKKQAPHDEDDSAKRDGNTGRISPVAQSLPPSVLAPATGAKKPSKTSAPSPQATPPALIICRNKHWRYISAFHGPWLQLPPEILETLANANYNTPRPRPIDPAVFFDLVKIRRLVDDATDLAVRAATGIASSTTSSVLNGPHHAAALGLGFGGNQMKLSRERKHRMREQATQKLARAYRLDEIASSVATMQSASALEEVGSLVLQRNPRDPDAKYVHFFHEKIPSRQLAECTNLTPLDEVLSDRPAEREPLRTRATIRVFKGDLEGAAADLTLALKAHQFHHPPPPPPPPPPHTAPKPVSSQQLETYEASQHRNARRQEDIVLKEDDQPRSLEIQLLFQRANVYLTMACQAVPASFEDVFDTPPSGPLSERAAPTARVDAAKSNNEDDEDDRADAVPPPELLSPAEKEAQRRVWDAQKTVKQNAKRALRDYTAYLSHFDYSPDLPLEIAEDFARKVSHAANGVRIPRSSYSNPSTSDSSLAGDVAAGNTSHRIYALPELFNAATPSDLPPYPCTTDLAAVSPAQQTQAAAISHPSRRTTETLTYHPLLSDALHSLLLCHCLIQTSAKELLRHAYMVARLARLADGYPVFQVSRSPARSDWIEILRRGDNWIKLAGTWETLCAPAPLPLFQHPTSGEPAPTYPAVANRQPKALAASATNDPAAWSAGRDVEAHHKEREQAILDTVGDDRVDDEASFSLALRARQMRAAHDYQLDNTIAALDSQLLRRHHASDVGGDATATGKAPGGAAEPELNRTADAKAISAGTSTTTTTNSTNATNNGLVLRPSAAAEASLNSGPNALNGTTVSATATGTTNTAVASPRRWSVEDGREYPILTDRAVAVARWVREAPANAGSAAASDGGARKRKKKSAAAKKAPAGGGGVGDGGGGGGRWGVAVAVDG